MGDEVADYFGHRGLRCRFFGVEEAAQNLDAEIVIVLVHVLEEERRLLRSMRESRFSGLVVGWYWDNHHMQPQNIETSALVDVSVPGHDFCSQYLGETSVLLPSVMLCVTQWTMAEAATFWASHDPGADRKSDLYGGYVRYNHTERNARLDDLIASGKFPGLYFIDELSLDRYFDLTPQRRFEVWTQHATSLCLPFHRDLSQRFFDAWLTGQIPVVSPDIEDLNRDGFAAKHLGVDFVRASGSDAASIELAHLAALERYARGGVKRRIWRYQRALSNHMFCHRIAQILHLLRTVDVNSNEASAGTGQDRSRR